MNTTSNHNDKEIVDRTEKTTQEVITYNINRHMTINNMIQKELAALVGVRVTTVNNWIRGVSMPSMENLIKLAEIFRITEGDLFIGEPKDGDARNKYAYMPLQKQDLLKLFDKNADFRRYIEIGLSAARSGQISELLKKVQE